MKYKQSSIIIYFQFQNYTWIHQTELPICFGSNLAVEVQRKLYRQKERVGPLLAWHLAGRRRALAKDSASREAADKDQQATCC